ncbi:MAG: PIN domain-containing protein [Candidatus Pacebacteria bacterium]|nr:PIN domain-containing protein [Candidatus Paceibacterota bacterium]
MKNIIIDTNVLIFYFEGDDALGPELSMVFQAIKDGRLKASTSALVLTELLEEPITHQESLRDNQYSNLDQEPLQIEFLPLDKKTALKAQQIRQQYHFKTPDAVLLATAVNQKVDYLLTNDHRLDDFQEIKIKTLQEVELESND